MCSSPRARRVSVLPRPLPFPPRAPEWQGLRPILHRACVTEEVSGPQEGIRRAGSVQHRIPRGHLEGGAALSGQMLYPWQQLISPILLFKRTAK